MDCEHKTWKILFLPLAQLDYLFLSYFVLIKTCFEDQIHNLFLIAETPLFCSPHFSSSV